MVNLKINGIPVSVSEGTTVLEAARKIGVSIPTLCYYKDLCSIGACRICVVEIKGDEHLSAACSTVVTEGMEVLTESERARAARMTNLRLILSSHNTACTSCLRSENCALKALSEKFNILDEQYEKHAGGKKYSVGNVLVKDESKCVCCYRCVSACEKIQGLNCWVANGSGAHTKVLFDRKISLKDAAGCALCGQCVTHCPTGALTVRDDTAQVIKWLSDPGLVTVVQIAPAVRAAWATEDASVTVGRLAASARRLGFGYVFDTSFAADLTILEEANELVARILGGQKGPMFTSCCPGWVRFMKARHPDMVPQLSTAKSPQQMFGAVTKTYFAEKIGVSPEKIRCVSVMPCSAKKYEADVEALNATAKDVDLVITSREYRRLLRAYNIDVSSLDEEGFDSPLGVSTGAGVIFGATGGVLEAALRTAYKVLTGDNPDADAFAGLRSTGDGDVREAALSINGLDLNVAAVSGLANTERLIQKIVSGEKKYDFVEVMACPGGCAGGGGQPIREGEENAFARGKTLYALDRNGALRYSHENPEIVELYESYLGRPLSEKAHHLLHTDQREWKM